jgi:hypothetical protein
MSQPAGPPAVVPTPDETIMKRLTYIQLLYRQAVAQSYATPPLNFSTVLAFHDVLELFFIVAVNHLGNPQGINLKAPFADNIRKFRAPDGNQLSSVDAVQRIGHDRNGFKHNGSIPGPDQVEQTRRDATRFLEGNCPRLFGIEFGALAFDQLIMDWGNEKYVPGSSFLTETLHFDAHRYRSHRRIDVFPRPSDPATESLILSVTKAFEDVDKQLKTMRRVLRIQIAGVDTASYIRFAMITPEIGISADGHRYPVETGQLYYTRENYDLCEMFVVNSALQIGQNDFKLWMPKTYGDIDRAIEAMAANGGRLPDNM